ncbi:MAG: hypothetical protein BWY63_03691 [Chloroflexi bacterium ADurb.Bin360]|nr:MAG: hypothetical protein BWY63_03691 [Chloroflexi bacterium ADurb.Bin360]
MIDFVIHHRMPRRALFHKLGENTGLIGCHPFRRHLLEEQFTHGFSPPVGDDIPGIDLARFGTDFERRLLTRVQNIQVFQRMAAEFWERRSGFRSRTLLAYNQFAGVDTNRLVLQ